MGRTASKSITYSKLFSVTIPWGFHRPVSGFLDSNMGKHQSQNVSVYIIPPLVAQMKKWKKLPKSSIKTNEDGKIRPLIWNTPLNSKQGLNMQQLSVNLCLCCSLISRAAAYVCVPGAAG